MNTCTPAYGSCNGSSPEVEGDVCEIDLEFYGCATQGDLEEAA